jgi:hypothetical protein
MSDAPFRLGREGLAVALPASAGPTAAFAADQLAYYLALLTGHMPAITDDARAQLRLEVAPALPAGAHGWSVTPAGATLRGADEASVLHAVYHFLECACGCRWLSEWEGGEIIPREPDLAVAPAEETHTPVFAHREFTNYPDIDARTVQMVDWMCKNRFNRFMVFANMEGAVERYREVLREHVVLRGMGVTVGHHSFKYWLPPGEHFAEHPEWFAQVNGARTSAGQVCVSNPAVPRVMAERICAFLHQNPEVDRVGLWPNDAYDWCECEACAALEPSPTCALFPPHPVRTESYLHLVRQVADLVAREHPGKRLSALAYLNYVEPPREDLPANVAVCYAPFLRCFKHPLDAPGDCTRPNARYAEFFDAWRQRVQGDLYLFGYHMLIDMCSLPYRTTGMLGPNMQWMAAHGCDGYVMEFRPEEWGAYGVNGHLLGRVAWDPDMDVPAWLAEYGRDRYGPAAGDMAAFWADYQERFVDPGPCVHHYDLGYARRATPELLRPALEHLGRARALAAGGEARHCQAVEQARVGMELLLRMGAWQRAVAEAETPGATEAKLEILRARERALAAELTEWAQAHAASGALYAPGIAARTGLP